jgi:hypothetical protein
MKEQGPEKEWCWPVRREAYDCASALTEAEISFLATARSLRINYSGPRFPALAAVRRLIEPLDDVFRYIAVHKPKCDQLIALLLKEMDERQISFWGWQDQQWFEIVENHRYFAGWMIAAAYLLCDFQSLAAFPKRRQVFPSLAQRVFGAQRFAAVVATVRSELTAARVEGPSEGSITAIQTTAVPGPACRITGSGCARMGASGALLV